MDTLTIYERADGDDSKRRRRDLRDWPPGPSGTKREGTDGLHRRVSLRGEGLTVDLGRLTC